MSKSKTYFAVHAKSYWPSLRCMSDLSLHVVIFGISVRAADSPMGRVGVWPWASLLHPASNLTKKARRFATCVVAKMGFHHFFEDVGISLNITS